LSNPPGSIKYTDMKRILLLFLVLVQMLTANLCSQDPGEYKTQLMKYLKDERINESLILATIALKDYPDDPFFQVIGSNPDPEGLLFLKPSPGQIRKEYENLLNLADILIALDIEYAGAGLDLYKEIEAAIPDNREISYRYARQLLRSENPQDKKKAYELDFAANDDSTIRESAPESGKFQSILALISSRESLAPENFSSSCSEFATDSAVLQELAQNSLNRKDCTDALEYLEMSIRIDPWKPELHQLQAEAFSCLGDQEQSAAAGDLADRFIRNEATFSTLSAKYLGGQSEEAVHGLELLVGRHPEFRDGVRLLARHYSGIGKRIEAVAVYKNYLRVIPDDIHIRDLAARMLLDEGLNDQAAALMTGASVTETGRLISAYQMIRGNNPKGAEKILKEILVDNPLDPMVIIMLSQSLSSQGKITEARTFLKKGAKVNPGSPMLKAAFQDIEFDYARHLSENGRRQESVAVYRELIKLNPANSQYLLNLGYEEMMNGEYGRAVGHLRKGLKLSPSEDWARSSLAYCLMNEWEFDAAVEQMKILISRSDDPDYLYQLGSMYNQIGNTREGWALIRKAAKQGHPEAAKLVKKRYGKD
jgi:predicted Zn-dependent protease